MKFTDILIVGHGLSGALLSLELHHHNVNFMVMEDLEIPKSSSVAGGLFNPVMFNKVRMARMIDKLWPDMLDTYRKIETMTKTKFLHNIGSFKLLNNKELSEWKEESKGAVGQYISIDPGHELAGVRKPSAIGLIKESGYIEINKLIESSEKILRAESRYIEAALEYDEMVFSDKWITINGAIKAQRIVFCEGASVVRNPWFMDAGISPNKGELVEIEAPGLDERYIIRDKLFILPLGKGRFKVGATYNHQSVDNLPSHSGLFELEEKLKQIITVPYRIVVHQAGIRPAVRDRLPILGRHPDNSRLLIFNGLGSKGVVYAPYCSKLILSLLLDESTKIPAELDVQRYFKVKHGIL